MTVSAGMPEAARARSHWRVVFGVGLLVAALGVVALGNLVASTVVTTVIVGFALLVAGAVQLAGAIAATSGAGGRIVAAVLGLVYVAAGFNMITEPLRSAVALAIVISILIMAGGAARMIGAMTGAEGSSILAFVVGFVDVLLGFWLFSGIPVTGIAIGFFVGLDLLMAGIAWMLLGWGVRSPADADPGTPGSPMPPTAPTSPASDG